MARRVGALLAALVCLAVLVEVERAPERPLVQQPFPDSAEYTNSARSLARDEGFYTFIYKGHIQPPRYPPGYPMALAPFAAVGSHPRDVQRGAKFWAMGYVLVAALSDRLFRAGFSEPEPAAAAVRFARPGPRCPSIARTSRICPSIRSF